MVAPFSSVRAHLRARRWLLSCWLVLGVGGCALSGGEFSPMDGAVRSWSGAPLTAVPAVTRFVLDGSLPLALEHVLLVEGEVSTASLRQLAQGKLPKTVADHRRPLTAWREPEQTVLAPGEVLRLGQAYSLVLLGGGLLAEFRVEEQPRPVLHRASSQVAPDGWAIYCIGNEAWGRLLGETPQTRAFDAEDLAGGGEWGVQIGLDDGLAEQFCLRLAVPADAGPYFIPPPELGEVLLEPTPLPVGPVADLQDHPPARLLTRGSSAFLQTSPGFTWVETRPLVAGSESPEVTVVYHRSGTAGLLPLGSWPPGAYWVRIATVHPDGSLQTEQGEFRIVEETGQLVLTEVLANPLGPEPASEWIEVQNVGRAPVSLGEYRIADSGGSFGLPAVLLPAGAVGLIVREDFRGDGEQDVLPRAEAVPVVVPSLGDGLLNSGERLQLVDGTGDVVSTLPALEPRPGVSVARRHPLAPDSLDSFGRHGPPGSSPGGPNVLEDAP